MNQNVAVQHNIHSSEMNGLDELSETAVGNITAECRQ